MALTEIFGQTKESVLGNAFGGAANFMSDKISVHALDGLGSRDLGGSSPAVSNGMDFGAPQI